MPVYPPKGSTTPKLPLVVNPWSGNGATLFAYRDEPAGLFVGQAFGIDATGENVRTQFIQWPKGVTALYAWCFGHNGVLNDVDVTPSVMGGPSESALDTQINSDGTFKIASLGQKIAKKVPLTPSLLTNIEEGWLVALSMELRENQSNFLVVAGFVLE